MTPDGKDVRDVTPGHRDAVATSDTFSSCVNFTFPPDGKFLVLTAVPAKDEAWSTNYEICRVAIDNKSKDWECLTKDNQAADNGPVFSPDGKRLAYRAQKKAGYEADKWNVMVVRTDAGGAFQGTPENRTGAFEQSIDDVAWPADDSLAYTFDLKGTKVLSIECGATDDRPGEYCPVLKLPKGGAVTALSVAPAGLTVAIAWASLHSPPEVYVSR